ncbi:Transcription factor TFIID complex subunit Taf13 [Taphrina deformans PYCC 5710]|uniref:Transcription initiation factor TFIID subunit 13 n=1 Tax=Taphrina deformans (strain PYCC 5710 / ATCC 11124 / CBS 356.35 / IMI 108563 / JCM 9778 / NBRC 8474) TaxID=1097556 RepID=R4XH42_TAPDE|nr:Transcription factor TFIID complex subunit Taf13 [Taphrina deformans PYCC 5710]|eukprot:CCG82701.1 Transcription factor TFIID complex subunit Taf13 [Taphrina deformans PYCC 5710]
MSTQNEGRTKRGRPTIKKSNLFAKDLKSMMYAFGDEDPTQDSINVMEDILTDFITELCTEAGRVAGPRQKVKVDDFKFVLRNDPKKLGRVEELLSLQKEIQQSRKLFDESAEK